MKAAQAGLLIVFDLDDTLFPEREYVLSGFRHIARLTAEALEASADEIFKFLESTSTEPTARGQIFNRFIEAYPSIGDQWSVETLVHAYRCHTPELKLFPGVEAMLDELRDAEIELGIITDGPPDSQRRKLQALEPLAKISAVVVTDEFGIECRKPSKFAYSRIRSLFDPAPGCSIYVGDNPAKDFFGARSSGWNTVRLRMAGQYHERAEAASPEFAPDDVATSIDQLRSYLLECAADSRIAAREKQVGRSEFAADRIE